ncbi:MAG: chorismate mutase [Candidatus Nanoarchaeia archaeon]|nr:chorismate mutase [Candidatus Nanoarchaeia archaeon]
MKNKISTLRKEINKIDNRIFALFVKRFKITKKIMKEKNKLNIPRTDLRRENEIISNKIKRFGNLDKKFIENIYRIIFKKSKGISC